MIRDLQSERTQNTPPCAGSKQTLTFDFGSLDELRKRQQERLDSEAWQEDMYYDAQNGEAEND